MNAENSSTLFHLILPTVMKTKLALKAQVILTVSLQVAIYLENIIGITSPAFYYKSKVQALRTDCIHFKVWD